MSYTTTVRKYLKDEQLESNEKLIMVALSNFKDEKSCHAQVNYDELMKYTGIHELITLNSYLYSLFEKGYISIKNSTISILNV